MTAGHDGHWWAATVILIGCAVIALAWLVGVGR